MKTIQKIIYKMEQKNQLEKLSENQTSLQLKNLEFLPTILRNEIGHKVFKDSGSQIDVLNKIVAMLAVNFHDDEERKVSASEWVLFVSEYKLTAPEIIEAYKLTLQRKLKNDRNETIRIFPNLSLISAGEILESFIEYKKNSFQYQSGKEELQKLLNPIIEKTPEEIEEQMKLNFEKFIQEVKAKKENVERRGFIFFNWLFNSGKLEKVLPTKKQLGKLRQDKMKILIRRENIKPMFFTRKELVDLNALVLEGKQIPVSNYVVQEIRDEIVLKYVKNLK